MGTSNALDREQLETFATIVAEGSFERAALLLNVSRGAVSQRIKALEEALMTILLVRDRPVVATPAGEVLLRHVKSVRMSEQATMTALRPPSDGVTLVPIAVAVNADSLASVVRTGQLGMPMFSLWVGPAAEAMRKPARPPCA